MEASSSRPRRQVRLPPRLPDESSSDEEDGKGNGTTPDGDDGELYLDASLRPGRHYSTDNSPQSRLNSSSKIIRPNPVSRQSDWRNKFVRPNTFSPVDPQSYWTSQPQEDYHSDEEDPISPLKTTTSLIAPPAPPRTPSNSAEERERLEWQSMLASVLAGDVLQEETSRIGEERGSDETFRAELGRSLWWQIRAKLRARSEAQEKQRTEERRNRVVDIVLEEVEKFEVKASPGPVGVGRRLSAESTEEVIEEVKAEASALDQVSYILQKLSLVEGLYPHSGAFRAAKHAYDSEQFQARVDALTSWSTVVYLLQTQLATLQKWTGSDDLDITRPNTTMEKALVGKNRYHPLDGKAKALNDQAADDTTFLERIMKEDSLQRTFNKRIFRDLETLVMNAKETVISHLPIFNELRLPDFQFELVRLIGFPGRLVIEALKVRLDAAGKLVDPNSMVLNDMVENFRTTISLAVKIKRGYLDIVEPDEENHWVIPHCLPPEYDQVLSEGLRMFFRLLQWSLKNGAKTIYFRETEILEGEMEFLSRAAEAIPGGDMLVAEHLW